MKGQDVVCHGTLYHVLGLLQDSDVLMTQEIAQNDSLCKFTPT